jgi:DNA-binding transcriptional regulator YdaS (Cro superfamily)
MKILDKAISLFDSQADMAKAINVGPMSICHWKKRGVPAKHCLSIERATNGQVKATDLRPDIFGDAG